MAHRRMRKQSGRDHAAMAASFEAAMVFRLCRYRHNLGGGIIQVIGGALSMCTLIPRKIWKDGKIERNLKDFAGWAAAVAQSEDVPLVDLNEIIARRYDAVGPEKVDPLFGDPHTHTSRAGAELNAECVIAGLKALAANPLAQFFSLKARDIAPYDAGVVPR